MEASQLEKTTQTFLVTYLSPYPSMDGSLQLRAAIVKIKSEESLDEIGKRLREEGFHDKNAGHDWRVMPGAILTIEEVRPRVHDSARRRLIPLTK